MSIGSAVPASGVSPNAWKDFPMSDQTNDLKSTTSNVALNGGQHSDDIFELHHAKQELAERAQELIVRSADATAYLLCSDYADPALYIAKCWFYDDSGVPGDRITVTDQGYTLTVFGKDPVAVDGWTVNEARARLLCGLLVDELWEIAAVKTKAELPPIIDEWFGMKVRIREADEGKAYEDTVWHALTSESTDHATEHEPYDGAWCNYHFQIGYSSHRPADVEGYLRDLIAIADRVMAERGAERRGRR
jgi:hypothetical protein